MDFLKKLDALMGERNLNKRKLSIESGIPYTTINGWYTRGYGQIKLPALQSLSTFFGVTMEWLMDETKGLDEKESVRSFNSEDSSVSREALAIAQIYDSLDAHGKRMIRMVADLEAERCDSRRDPLADVEADFREQISKDRLATRAE